VGEFDPATSGGVWGGRRGAIRIPPLPLGLIGGLIAGVIQFATGRHVAEVQVSLKDGSTLRLKADPTIIAQMQDAAAARGVRNEQ
jgi:hypothetical protein